MTQPEHQRGNLTVTVQRALGQPITPPKAQVVAQEEKPSDGGNSLSLLPSPKYHNGMGKSP